MARQWNLRTRLTASSAALVADDVRTLAARCAEAAQETAGLIDELHKRAAEGHGRVKFAVDAADESAAESEELNQTSARLAEAIGELSRLVGV
jgi:methyl-accepting chemotaxis protein